MKRLLFVCGCALLLAPQTARAGVCEEWNALFTRIRDFQVEPQAARQAFAGLHRRLQTAYAGLGDSRRVFPVAGYGPECGEEGRGFQPKGYRFFTGNPEGRHPSLDLFIHDRDQDSRDDRSGQPVTIVAYTSGVVVGLNRQWSPGDPQRGGLYVWLYDPRTEHYSYYAHLSRVDVELGQTVAAGTPLGLLGRSGKNASQRRSPTHLHLQVLAWQRDNLVPFTPWPELLHAERLPAQP